MKDIDKNGDGKINLDEYIGKLLLFYLQQIPPFTLNLEAICPKCFCFCSTGDMYTPDNEESEPDWVQTERKHFSEFRDANKVKAGQLLETGVVH